MASRISNAYVKELQEGNANALNEIYKFYRGPLYYYAFSILKNAHEAEEVVQEVMLKVQMKIHQLKKLDAFHSWMFTIATNECNARLNKQNKYIQLDDENAIEEVVEAKDNQIDELTRSSLMDAIIQSFSKLNQNNKRTAELRFLGGFSMDEIASEMDVDTKKVKSRLYEIRKKVSKDLKDQGYHPRKYFSVTGIPLLYQEMTNRYQAKEQTHPSIGSNEQSIRHGSIRDFVNAMIRSEKSGVLFTVFLAAVMIFPQAFGILQDHDLLYDVYPSITSHPVYKVSNREDTIASIAYDQSPIAGPIEIRIYTKEKVTDAVQITFQDENCAYTIFDEYIQMYANDNGRYYVKVGNDEQYFEVDNIDQKIPVIKGIKVKDDVGYFIVQEAEYDINYDLSYVIVNGSKVPLTKELYVSLNQDKKIEVMLCDMKKHCNEFSFTI
ncbi:RNA polymerase sigma factor (sigma-70 family) [Breznakia blatticola]|uniref:RNA polymerase sigma factor (Sigma-70 family) n=1 Tax=Breznakia blatticola TaxID=1754012 RepID=A0A4R7ZFA8_9FIRM|nr:RNA polymerase sigma factor [Breznakia blatticola]TDW16317.1 RNA polymerase sigma factor (sigma-70 family) [Breznakia blatticola]